MSSLFPKNKSCPDTDSMVGCLGSWVRQDTGSQAKGRGPGTGGSGVGQEGRWKGCTGTDSKVMDFLFLEQSNVRCQ